MKTSAIVRKPTNVNKEQAKLRDPKSEAPRKTEITVATNETKTLASKPRRFVSVNEKETCKKIQSTWKGRGGLLEKLDMINGLLDHPIISTDSHAAATICQRHIRGWLERRYTHSELDTNTSNSKDSVHS
jgi:hypothetical protein